MGTTDVVKHVFEEIRNALGGDPSTSDRYICAGCRSTFRRRHSQCPECGSRVVTPLDSEQDEEGRAPWES
ncbi:MAG: hypothetical protein ABEJ40_10795 [Haloarculaceae archaeon]